MKTRTKKSKAIIPEVVPANTAVAFFHAAHPEVKSVQEAQIREFCPMIGQFVDFIRPVIKQVVESNAQPIWEIGMKVATFIDTTPCKGKELSEDLYRQYVFLDAHGNTISRDMLNWFARIARKFPAGVDKTFSALEVWRDLPNKFGEQKALPLTGEPEPAKDKPMPFGPYDYFRTYYIHCQEESAATAKWLAAFKENPQYGDFGTLKQRRPDLHFEMHKKLGDAVAARLKDVEALKSALDEMGQP
jgi:hypothetical protein